LGSRRSFANPSSSRALLDVRIVLGDLFVILGAILVAELCLLLYVWVSYLRRRGSGADSEEKPGAGSWSQRLVAGVAALLLFAVFIGIAARSGDDGPSALQGLAPLAPLPPLDGSAPSSQAFVIHWWILLGLALSGLAGVLLALLVRRRRQRRRTREAQSPSVSAEREGLLAAVEASLDELEDHPDARDAVIRAYVGMERTLSRHGLGRRPSETPLEYLARWTGAVRVGLSPAEALTRLYERARFSPHLVDEDMRHEATSALVALRHELGGEALGGEPG
jgi:hypothetical protein